MSIGEHIQQTLKLPATVVSMYLEDLSDEDLLRRPSEGSNHIAWQLGHLISSENRLNNTVCPDSMPELPEGFDDRHTKETASLDDPSSFLTKTEYINAMNEQREGTLALLGRLSDDELSAASPDSLAIFGPTVAAVIAGQAAHWMMHAGQWAVVRRQLGKEPLF